MSNNLLTSCGLPEQVQYLILQHTVILEDQFNFPIQNSANGQLPSYSTVGKYCSGRKSGIFLCPPEGIAKS